MNWAGLGFDTLARLLATVVLTPQRRELVIHTMPARRHSGILDEIATALSDQRDYDHQWLIDPRSGQISFWTADTGIDGQNPVDLEDVDLTPIDPFPSYVWYQDMADFGERLSDDAAARRLARAIQGRGAFRRFKNTLYEELPELLPAWHAFREARAHRRAVEWLAAEGLVREDAAEQYRQNHPDPDLP